jgi:thiol-disulfide isomerase/thioredoxin
MSQKSFIPLFAILMMVLFHHCTQKQNIPEIKFDLQGESKLTFSNLSKSDVRIKFEKWSSIPVEFVNVDTLIASGTDFQINLKNHSMDYVYLDLNQENVDIFMLPGSEETLTILEIDSIVFSGDLSHINYFLFQNSKKDLGFHQLNHVSAMVTHGEKDFMRFISLKDSIHKVQLHNLEANKSNLPKWYVKLEKERLEYKHLAGILNSISYRKNMLKIDDDIPEDFLGTLVSSVQLENEKFIGESNYMLFLHEYANLQSRKKSITEPDDSDSKQALSIYMAEEVEGLFTGKVKDAFLAYRLSMLLKYARSEYDSMVLDYFVDRDLRDLISDYYYSSVALKEGVRMPYFFLENPKGEDVESNEYLGNILLINFWADWCKPCIVEFPHENALAEKYQGKPVKILNICIESNRERWKEYILRYGLKMDNLFAEENWTKKLKSTYDISGIPHSVLIDWNGNIVENRTKTASKGVDKLIDELLRKMETVNP